MTEDENPSFKIQDRTVTFPVEVRDASAAIAGFLVSSQSAGKLVGPAFEIVDFLPGRTLFMLGCIDYKDNDLGAYNEVAMNFFVRRAGAVKGFPYVSAWREMALGRLASYSWKMPVNQSFTRDAGATIWGFPKTVDRVDFDNSQSGRFHGLLEMDGQKVFEIDMPRGGDQARPGVKGLAYSYIQGVPHQTTFTQQSFESGLSRGGRVELSLGDHSIAESLRSLGLPKKPLMATWIGKMRMTFGPPSRL